MKVIGILFLNICLFNIIYSQYLENFDYLDYAINSINKYSKRIAGVKGKTNKTKCYTKTDIKINDTLFKYDKQDILSSETCFHPKKTEVLKNISAYTNDTYEQNKMLLAFCIYYVLLDPEFAIQIPKTEKFHILSLPIEEVKHSEKLFDYPDLNEFLIAGKGYYIEESDRIEKIIDRNLDIQDRYNEYFKLYSKIYYYITTHSFNINGKAIILPFMEICDIVPYYLTKPDDNYTNSSFVEEEGNKILVKSARNFKQSEQYLFSFNVSLDNDQLMLKHGIFVHDNIYDKFTFNKLFSYEHNYETDELFHNLKRHNLDPNIFDYKRENLGHDGWYKFSFIANKTSDLLYRFGIIYFNWWKTHSNDKNTQFRHIAKQALTLIVRMIYDEFKEIKERMEVSYDEYLLKTQEDKTLTELNRKLRHFNIEKIHLLNKNVNYLYKDLVLLNYNEIKQKKDKYVMIDPNKDA